MAQVINTIYVGEFATDAAAKTYINSTQFLKDAGFKKAADVVWTATFYLNTTIGGFRIWTGTVWDFFGAGYGGDITGIVYVAKNGDDALGDGSITQPYLTVQAGITALGVGGGAVLVGPGTYTEQLALTTSVDIIEMTPGTVTIQETAIGGAVITVTPPATDIIVRIKCSVVNLSNASAADMAIHVNNVAGLGTGLVFISGADTISGGAAGQFLRVTGDNAAQTEFTRVILEDCEHLIGAFASVLEAATDVVRFNNCLYEGGNAAWMDVSGPAGDVIIANCLQAAAAAGEVIDYGLGTAVGCSLHIGSSVLAGQLSLNSNAGTGIVHLSAEARIGRITSTLANQSIHRWLGGDDLLVQLLNIDIAAGATLTLYTPPAGFIANPFEARVVNTLIGAPTGAGFSYSFDGTAPGSVVAIVGAAAVVAGVTNCVVVIDAFPNPTPLTFTVVAGGAPGDTINVEAVVKVSVV